MNRYTHSFALAFLGYLILFGSFLLIEPSIDRTQNQKEHLIPIAILSENQIPQPIIQHTPPQTDTQPPHYPAPQELKTIQKEEPILSKNTPSDEVIAPSIAHNTTPTLPQEGPKEMIQEVIATPIKETKPSPQPKTTPIAQTAEQSKEPYRAPQTHITPSLHNTQTPPPKKIDTTHLKKQFFTTLKAKIEHNKYYPSIAKRRGIEGLVEVKFEILPNGTLCNLQIISGHKVFFESAKEAIEQCFPLQVPNEIQGELGFVTLMLEYKIL